MLCNTGNCQETGFNEKEVKSYQASKLTEEPQIDGILLDDAWSNLPVATDFVMLSPGNGGPSRSTHPTRVKIGYTNDALYIGAYLYDDKPESIRQEFAQRDNVPQTDYFVVDINTYNDGENQTRFVVTSAGTLSDAKMKGKNQDYNYNVVWNAEVSIDNKGWYVEMKIPFSALRFPDKEKQLWSIQFGRRISSLNEIYVWSPINKSVGKTSDYNGLLTGINHIDPPVRLSFYPYLSGQFESFNSKSKTGANLGMDLKYGINDAFTLDMTLIPDFGQTAFDEVELNLGPYEQTYGEKRAFFTEGTELFNKGNLFYSRRIGQTPIGFSEVERIKTDKEIVVSNPQKTQLLNAVKISGRTTGGLGIGFLNAISDKEFAVLENTDTNLEKEILTQPLTNYNILVLDQQIDQSSVTLVNTNVVRDGYFRDANVSAFLFDLFNSSRSYNFAGEFKHSHVNLPDSNINGYASQLSLSRTKGKFRYSIAHDFANEGYDINDLGVNVTNNYNNFFWSTSYQIFEPQGFLNKYEVEVYGNHQRRYDPNRPVRSGIGSRFVAQTRNNFLFGGFLDLNTKYYDYFEPRKKGKFVIYPENHIGDIWFSTDNRRKLSIDTRLGYSDFHHSDYHKLTFNLSPKFRINKRFSIFYSFDYLNEKNRPSYVGIQKDVIFGLRNRVNVENSILASYNFNNNKAVQLNFRNFWSSASYNKKTFGILDFDGKITSPPKELDIADPDVDYNIWNLDLSYNWRFAPGSELILLYRNSLFNQDQNAEQAYFESLSGLWDEPIQQSLSFKFIYYIEFQKLKSLFKS